MEDSMSTQNTAQLSPEDAYNVLVAQVHAPVFFEKLARVYGVQPRNKDEAREFLLMAGQLRNAHEQETVKQAAVGTNLLSEARRDLNKVLAQSGYESLGNEDHGVKQAASAAAQNPLLQEAALVFANFMAQRLQS
jgi:hypothetical protein